MRFAEPVMPSARRQLGMVASRAKPANGQYSAALITQMRQRHTSRPQMTWLEMDVLDLQFGEDEFDLVVDKGAHSCRSQTES